MDTRALRICRFRAFCLPWLAMLVIVTLTGASAADDAYYMLIFGSQRTPPDPDFAHSFATFVHVDHKKACAEAYTISWLPQNEIIRTFALLPEPGKNFELHTTVRFVLTRRERISLWGPYQIQKELHDRALQHIGLLQSGQVLYKANDIGNNSNRVTNCIHAISEIVDGVRLAVLISGWGESASFAILERMRPFIINPDRVHPQIGSALGLDAYPIIYRDFTEPRSSLVIGAVGALVGRDRNLQASFGPPTNQQPTLSAPAP